MGLYVSHDCWRGAYSAFGRWRNKLAEVAGYSIKKFDMHETADINWDAITSENLLGEWPDGPPEDPLLLIIAHSDYDGIIHHEHAPWLAGRLEQLLPKLPDGEAGGHIGDWREKTQAFIDGLRRAADAGEKVEFW